MIGGDFLGTTMKLAFRKGVILQMNKRCVKYHVGLRLAQQGIYSLDEAATLAGISRPHLSNIIGMRRTAAKQQQLVAKLCKCTAEEIFREYTNPQLLKAAAKNRRRNQTKRS